MKDLAIVLALIVISVSAFSMGIFAEKLEPMIAFSIVWFIGIIALRDLVKSA